MGVPMRMRCDNCGYDFVGQLHYSDQRRGDVIRCKACDYEVPVLSDEEISAVEATLNKERNWGIYALVAWAVFFLAVVILGVSYFWQVGAGLGGENGAKNEEILWTKKEQTALYLRANVTANDNHQVNNTSLIGRYDAATGEQQVKTLNEKLKALSDKLAGIGESIDATLTKNATYHDDTGKQNMGNTFDQRYGQFISGNDVSNPNAPALTPPGDWERVEDPINKRTLYSMTNGEDYTFKATLPGGATADVPMKLFVQIVNRPIAPGSDDKPQILGHAELRATEGEITMVVDPFSKHIIRTEILRPAGGAEPDTASAIVHGRGFVLSQPQEAAGFKAAKDTSPTGVQLGMMVLMFFSLVAALVFSWFGNKARYTMQLGIVDKEEQAAAAADAVEDEDADIGGGDLPANNQATARMDDDLEIS